MKTGKGLIYNISVWKLAFTCGLNFHCLPTRVFYSEGKEVDSEGRHKAVICYRRNDCGDSQAGPRGNHRSRLSLKNH